MCGQDYDIGNLVQVHVNVYILYHGVCMLLTCILHGV